MTRMITVPNRMPKPSETAMGMRNRAWSAVSKIIGANPKNVVNDVRTMGRNRFMAP